MQKAAVILNFRTVHAKHKMKVGYFCMTFWELTTCQIPGFEVEGKFLSWKDKVDLILYKNIDFTKGSWHQQILFKIPLYNKEGTFL